jgi:hypothetical protein
MNEYCQTQFETYDEQERIRRKQQELRLQQRELRAALLEVMRQKNMKNVQVEGPNGERLQVKISRYPVPRVITQDVLDEARIDWAAAFQLSLDEQVAHVVAEIKKVARDTRPYVDVVVCGKRSRDRLQLVGGGKSKGSSSSSSSSSSIDAADEDAAADPFADAVVRLAVHKQEMSRETEALKKLVGGSESKAYAAAVLQEMSAVDIRKRDVNLRSSDGRVHKFVLERKVEHRRPAVTVKVITAAVKAAFADNARRPRSPEAIKQFILDFISDATRPVPHESLRFRSAEKSGGVTAAFDGDDDEDGERDDQDEEYD